MQILAIESSCDETAAAVIRDGRVVVSQIVATSTSMYEKYGGIVPEVAAREQLAYLYPVLSETLKPLSDRPTAETIEQHIDAVAVAVGPGLIGSLLIGTEAAKTISFVTRKKIIPVNHVLAHMYANFLTDNPASAGTIDFPAISLVVSGGHTELFLMSDDRHIKWLGGTIDDAAGEAFDKTARLLGFGSRGGLAIQEASQVVSEPAAARSVVRLPRPMMHDDTLNFSFSGLKTAVSREWAKHVHHTPDITAAFAFEVQDAITDVLTAKTITAATEFGAKSILVSGGVAANAMLRLKFAETLASSAELMGIALRVPEIRYCTDNAAYIGSYAFFRGTPVPWNDISAVPDLSVEVTG